MTVTMDDIRAAARRIAGHVVETPLVEDTALSARLGQPIWLKCEYLQTTGAFKLRGATNAILSLQGKVRGVVTASTGNHGRAVAHAAKTLGVPATICLSRLVPANKVQAIRDLGATVRIVGKSQDEAMVEIARAVAEEGLTEIPPFDHPDVVAGQGTIGLEIGAPEAVLVPLSGGGLAAGIAVAIKALSPGTRVIGLTMENGAAMAASIRAGRSVEVTETASLADSLGGGIGLGNRVTFPLCRDLLDDVILLTEAEIAQGIRHLGRAGHMVEGAAAVGTAALLAGKFVPAGATVTILSGANIDPALHARVMSGASEAA
ncbi:hydroxyectoine utilization dehydratase EutB [Paracoccus aerius]|uniref:Hydroxyectoine utilization dehydratase EutB n=1 Tax=Paracoccus aerius TaxID=1915382 RepID=A0ABS1SA47_9RHOB|nr:hydroxyectoine utilization dehydratase EutB [Paracoccus aerius]MBL3674979.1 hydroxyectoine utilization dehydratase EutB [Paracoccus aerius]GHG34705.1 hydroxyectoine utilization dehydratase EutB [Paracoccus aerius]